MDDAPQTPDAHAFLARGQVYLRRGELDRALTAFSQALDLDPADADAFFLRANVHASLGRFDDAVDDFTAAIDLRPDFAGGMCFTRSIIKVLMTTRKESELSRKQAFIACGSL